MRFRRTLLLLLAYCLLFSQQAALAHGITHIQVGDPGHSVVTRPVVQSIGLDHHDDFCIECLAFAQVTGAAPGAAIHVAVAPPVAIAPPVAAMCRIDAAPFLYFQARAPPILH